MTEIAENDHLEAKMTVMAPIPLPTTLKSLLNDQVRGPDRGHFRPPQDLDRAQSISAVSIKYTQVQGIYLGRP